MNKQYYKLSDTGSLDIILWLRHINVNGFAQLNVVETFTNHWKLGELVTVRRDFLNRNCEKVENQDKIKQLDKKRLLLGIT